MRKKRRLYTFNLAARTNRRDEEEEKEEEEEGEGGRSLPESRRDFPSLNLPPSLLVPATPSLSFPLLQLPLALSLLC